MKRNLQIYKEYGSSLMKIPEVPNRKCRVKSNINTRDSYLLNSLYNQPRQFLRSTFRIMVRPGGNTICMWDLYLRELNTTRILTIVIRELAK